MMEIDSNTSNPINVRTKFLKLLGSSKFYVGIFKYKRTGRDTKLVSVFKVPRGVVEADPRVKAFIVKVGQEAPKALTSEETKLAMNKILPNYNFLLISF